MCVRCLGFVLLLCFPGVLHAQTAAQPCPAPPLNDGYLVPKLESYPHDTTLSYACDKGHKPAVGGWWATSSCENGQWSHQPQCINEKACILPTIPNAETSDNSNSWYEDGRMLTITCNNGYEPKDTTVRCVNGEWSSAPACERGIDACGEPPQIPHAVIIGQGYQEVFAAGSIMQYKCEDGHTTEGTNTRNSIVCSSGNWSEGPKCNALCSVNTDLYNELRSVGVKRLKEGQSKRLECEDLYYMDNFSVAQCTNGRVTLSRCCNVIQINMGFC